MMDTDDPITTFFPDEENVDLYVVLSLGRDAKVEDIKKAYRRLALVYHPDKHASASQDTKDEASRKFQQIGFAYAVLSDDKRRPRYDRTGRTDDGGADFGPGESGSWEAYFEELFDQVTKGKLDELKKEYQSTSKPPLCPFSGFYTMIRLRRGGGGLETRVQRWRRVPRRNHGPYTPFHD